MYASPPFPPPGFPLPTHVVVRSVDPAAANLAGYAVAASLLDQFTILEIRSGPEEVVDPRPWAQLVPASRHLIAFAPDSGGPPSDGTIEGSWPIVRADRPEEVLSHLSEFLATPAVAGRNIRFQLGMKGAVVALIVNGAGVTKMFPDDPSITGKLMAIQREFGMSIVLSADMTPRRDYVAFDFAFDVLPDPGNPGATRLRCVRAPPGVELRSGDDLRIDQLPGGPAALRELALRPGLSAGIA